jgi:hypothetical protein
VSSDRRGTHPARPFGVTGGGFAEGQNDPEEHPPEKNVGAFGTGQENIEEYPEDVKLGSFARGQQAESHIIEGTFGETDEDPEKSEKSEEPEE